MLWRYRQAHLVITTRIHVALPCVARGVPVIFVHHKNINDSGDVRTKGLTQLFHVLDFEVLQESAAQKWIKGFNFTNPPPNPNLSKSNYLSIFTICGLTNNFSDLFY